MAVHIEIQTVIMETNKHRVLSESKSVACYQKYVHIKACLGNILKRKSSPVTGPGVA
jgi:hypothetical protein